MANRVQVQRKVLWASLFLLALISIAILPVYAEIPYTQWGSQGNGNGQFDYPSGIAISSTNGNVYVTEWKNNRTQVFSASGNYLAQWGSSGSSNGQFKWPAGIAINNTGYVYIADAGNNRIQIFDANGNYINQWSGGLFSPRALAINSSNFIYVADYGNNRIMVFDPSGVYITQWSASYPLGVAVNTSGFVYVTESNNYLTRIFTSTGTNIGQWGSYGTGDGQFKFPTELTIDTSSNIFVIDEDNARIEVFNPSGQYLRKWGSYGTGVGQLSSPQGIAVNDSSYVYVAEYSSYRVQVFSSASAPSVTTITPSSGLNTGSIAFSSLTGTGFTAGAAVNLTKTGQANISATGVSVVSADKITGNFDITGSVAGTWNVIVTNPDGQFGLLTNGFTISALIPVAGFTGTPLSGTAPLSVSFTDSSLNLPTGWAWFFGDENFTAPWTLKNTSAMWTARFAHSSVVLPDGSIIVMGGSNGGSNRKNDTWRSTDSGATWTLMNASSGWTARMAHASVAMPDGSIVLMGGNTSSSLTNDTWRSIDKGATWTMVNSSPGWVPRVDHRTVVMADGSIVLMGGAISGGLYANDVWRSPDNGATWTLMNSGAPWSARKSPATVVMPDGSIVLMGGYNGINLLNDVWGSSDNGATWSVAPSPAGWGPREEHSSVVLPDGSILVMGGFNNGSVKSDMFRSKDKGFSWGKPNLSVEWGARRGHTSVVMPDGSIVLMGGTSGTNYKNDVWRFNPVGSTLQNPSHTYSNSGTYKVALQGYNTAGYNSTRKSEYITVSADPNAPKVSFTSNVTSGVVPLTVAFNDTSTGSPVSWDWSFGDNTSSTEQNPVHTFQKPQVNNVKLKVANSDGLTNQTMHQIVVFGIKTDTNMVMNGTTAAIINGKQNLAVNASTLQNTGGNVTTTNTILTMTGGNSFWTKTRFFADNVALNTTTGDYTITNTTQVVMQSAPVSASLNKSIGDVSVSLDLALKQYVPDAVANITITEGATTDADNAFQQAAQSSSINIKAIAYTIQFTNTEQINANLTQNATRQSQAAILSMNINHSWVSQFATSTNNDGRDSIVIVRYPETGSSKVLTTRFNSYNSSSNLDAFEADSPDGLSIFGMIGYSAQQAASNSNSVSVSDSDGNAVNQQATPQIFKETAPLKTDTSNQLAADVMVQSIDKIALLTLSRGIRATDTYGQTLAEVSVLPMDRSMVPPPETGTQYRFDGLAYHCRPDHAQFSQPVMLTFTLPQDEWNTVYANNREPVIRTYSTSTNKWESLPTIADPAAKTVSTSVTHFSDFAIFSKPALNKGNATATPLLTTTPVLTTKPGLTVIAGNPSPTPTASQKTSKPPANAFEIMAGLGLWGSGLIMNNPLIAVIGIIVIGIGYVGWAQYRKKKERDFIMYGRKK